MEQTIEDNLVEKIVLEQDQQEEDQEQNNNNQQEEDQHQNNNNQQEDQEQNNNNQQDINDELEMLNEGQDNPEFEINEFDETEDQYQVFQVDLNLDQILEEIQIDNTENIDGLIKQVRDVGILDETDNESKIQGCGDSITESHQTKGNLLDNEEEYYIPSFYLNEKHQHLSIPEFEVISMSRNECKKAIQFALKECKFSLYFYILRHHPELATESDFQNIDWTKCLSNDQCQVWIDYFLKTNHYDGSEMIKILQQKTNIWNHSNCFVYSILYNIFDTSIEFQKPLSNESLEIVHDFLQSKNTFSVIPYIISNFNKLYTFQQFQDKFDEYKTINNWKSEIKQHQNIFRNMNMEQLFPMAPVQKYRSIQKQQPKTKTKESSTTQKVIIEVHIKQ